MSSSRPNPDGLHPIVELNFKGVFLRNPFSYNHGINFTFNDHDFSGMTYSECITFLERFMQESIKKLYYCEPGKPLIYGITAIANDEDYGGFIFHAYGTDGKICMYVDHDGQGIEDWFGSEIEEEDGDDSCIDGGENEDEIDNLTDVDVDFNEDIVTMNRTKGDEFLNRLCGEEEEGNDNNINDHDGHEEDANVTQQHSIFNELVPWKKQIPILGMRFKDPSQLKSMLCNYAVANGYQLCFEKNDRKRLLVKCCKGECTFRLWASWMSDEASFQIKSLKPVHKCARNYKLGSMVTYAWIGSHYTREFLLRQKMSVRKLRTAVSQKFGIHVSVGQCRRAKKYALQLIDGTLVEHYAKLWSYAEEIRRSNPGSTVKLDVNHMPDGKNYFSKFYVCFDALKKGWKEGCRKIIGLDGCFLKGICKEELLCAFGRDANNGIYPIAWAVVCVENKENWRWFLDLLIDDLGLNLGYGYSVISDQHKVI